MSVVVSHWSANAVVLTVCVAVVVVHLLGMRATAAGGAAELGGSRSASPGAEAVAFYAGLLAILVALVSPIAYWSGMFVWVRSLQDLLLAVVAPALIVLGAPWLVLARGVGWQPGNPAGGPGPVARALLSRPVLVVAAFNVAWCGWHVPAAYDAALRNPAVAAAEVVTYLALGVGFWLQLIGSRPLTPRLVPIGRVMLLGATVVTGTVMAMVLAFGASVIYPVYRTAGHHTLSVVADQQVGGAVLWVLILPPYMIAGVALLIRWLNEEESEALTAGLDRLLKQPKSGWPSRPGLR